MSISLSHRAITRVEATPPKRSSSITTAFSSFTLKMSATFLPTRPGRSIPLSSSSSAVARVDLPSVLAALDKVKFRGWAVVELDRVPEKSRNPEGVRDHQQDISRTEDRRHGLAFCPPEVFSCASHYRNIWPAYSERIEIHGSKMRQIPLVKSNRA